MNLLPDLLLLLRSRLHAGVDKIGMRCPKFGMRNSEISLCLDIFCIIVCVSIQVFVPMYGWSSEALTAVYSLHFAHSKLPFLFHWRFGFCFQLSLQLHSPSVRMLFGCFPWRSWHFFFYVRRSASLNQALT